MGSIFSSSHRFAIDKPIREVERTGKTLRSRDKALQAKMERKVSAKRNVKERTYKQAEKERKRKEKLFKQSEKSIAKHPYVQKNKPIKLGKVNISNIKKVQKPKYNKWGDRIA